MSSLDDKIQQVKKDIETKNKKVNIRKLCAEINFGMLFLILIIIFLGLMGVSFIISSIKFNNMIDNDGLKIGKTFRLVCLIICIIGIGLSIKCLVTYRYKVLSVLAILAFGAFSVICVITSFNIKSVYYDDIEKVAYYEKKDGYEVGKVENNVNVTLYGEINGKIVSSLTAKFGNNVQTITFQGGIWELKKKLFSNASILKKIVVNDAELMVYKKCFEKNSYLSELCINNSTFKGIIGKNTDSFADESKMSIFNNSHISIFLNNSTLENLADDIDLLDISGESHIKVVLSEPASYEIIFDVNKVVVNNNVDLAKCLMIRNIKSYWISKDRYYSIGSQIYLPSSINMIPDYFFGDKLESDDEKIKVFFEGTQDEWNKIIINNNGNENYYSGNVTVIYNSK